MIKSVESFESHSMTGWLAGWLQDTKSAKKNCLEFVKRPHEFDISFAALKIFVMDITQWKASHLAIMFSLTTTCLYHVTAMQRP